MPKGHTKGTLPTPQAPLCLIPARGGSKRFPGKNVALLKGRPLIVYAISAAHESKLFETVYVSTEDTSIADIARDEGATVIQRPTELAGDRVGVVDVCIHTLDRFDQQGRSFDTLCLIYATAALMLPEDLRAGYELLLDKRANAVMGVTRYYEHPLLALRERGQFLTPAFPKRLKQSQRLPDYRVSLGYFYFIRTDILQQRRSFYVPRMLGYTIPRERAVDIDEPEHLQVAEALMSIPKRDSN